MDLAKQVELAYEAKRSARRRWKREKTPNSWGFYMEARRRLNRLLLKFLGPRRQSRKKS